MTARIPLPPGPPTARINYARAAKHGGFGTGVTEVSEFIRAVVVDPREPGGTNR